MLSQLWNWPIVSIGKMLKLSKCKKFTNRYIPDNVSIKEKSEQAHIPQTPPLLDNSTHNDSQGTHQIHKMIW